MAATVPSPVSTGGGGEQFEEALGAFALGLLLVRATPPLLLDTTLVEVSFQTRYLGWRTDDLLLVGEVRPGEHKRLAIQAKRAFTVSSRDEDCIETVRAMWDDFKAASRFDPTRDRLAIATLHGTATLLSDFRSLLEAARAAADATDFRRRRDTYLSQKARTQYGAVTEILQGHVPGGPSEDELWQFLRTVQVLAFDLGTPTAQHVALLLSLLAYVATGVDDPRAAAAETWHALLERSEAGRRGALTYRRDTLPAELRARHAGIATADTRAFSDLIEHGRTVRRGIRGLIGGTYEIDRASRVARIVEQLDVQGAVVIAGAAGSGKSALAARAVEALEGDGPVLAFQAVEFATGHINETLARTQSRLNEAALLAQLASHDRPTILVDGVERLLEHEVRDGFWHLLLAVKRTPGLRLLLTCRDYSLETVRSALLAPASLGHGVYTVPDLSDEELDDVARCVPGVAPALSDVRLRGFLRTPYLLDMASRLTWAADALPATARAFRAKCWRELVRADQRPADGMPRRRELAFIDVARKRAAELRPFVTPTTTDHEALDALEQASLLERAAPTRQLYAPAHDVLEDWAVLHWLDQLADGAGDDPAIIAAAMASAVSGLPALRRGFRRWLGERLESDSAGATMLVLAAMAEGSLPQHFRDDCAIAALSSDAAPAFIEGCRVRVAAGDRGLLRRLIHLLRVACKALPAWLPHGTWPSQMLVPTGPAWSPMLALVADTPPESIQDALLFLGLAEDWSRGVSIWSPTPRGADNAGRLLAQLLPHFADFYGHDEPRKRTLEAMLRIPRRVPGFAELLERARSPQPTDRAAKELGDLVAMTFSGAFACRDMPDEVIAVVRARLLMTDARRDRWSYSSVDVDECFGIHERVTEYFPPSALQGPFQALLQHQPAKGLELIVELLNHAGTWYGEKRWPGHRLEPAARALLDVPGVGPVEQWMNGRLYVLFRGMSVGPEVLKSALMALEAWLLRRGQDLGEDLEGVLLDIVARSNNVMATGVVASVCTALPERVGRAPLALLSCPYIVMADRDRMAHDQMGHQGILEGLNAQHVVYEQERKTADSLPHRREDLEMLALRLQQTPLRDDVWALIDRHRAALGDAQDEESRIWRLALHRMDLRGYRVMDPPPGAATEADDGRPLIYAGPGELEPDVKEMVDQSAANLATMNRYLRLKNLAYKLWRDRSAPESEQWRTFLAEAQLLAAEGEAPAPHLDGFAPGIAAVCLRDHRSELTDEECKWCVGQIESELTREADAEDERVIRARGFGADDAVAATAALIVAEAAGALESDADTFLARTLAHAVGEVADYAYAGAAAFLGPAHRVLLLRCAAAAAAEARAAHEAMEAERRLGRLAGSRARSVAAAAREAVRAALRLDAERLPAIIDELDFETWTGLRAAVRIAKLFELRPDWQEARAFFAKASAWLAATWRDDREKGRRGSGGRHYEMEAALADRVARFVLRLPPDVARETCAPLIQLVPTDPRELESFMQHLIGAADGSTGDSFWDVWQGFADAVVAAPWAARLGRERAYESSLVGAVFLGTWWKEGVRHWDRLDGHEERIPDLARRLPPAPSCLHAFLRYLATIGQRSLPQAFVQVHEVVSRGDATKLLGHRDSAYYLETLLGRYVYAQPHRLKSEAALRRAVLELLDALVEAGSSAAYRMRDDFVTPPRPRGAPTGDAAAQATTGAAV